MNVKVQESIIWQGPGNYQGKGGPWRVKDSQSKFQEGPRVPDGSRRTYLVNEDKYDPGESRSNWEDLGGSGSACNDLGRSKWFQENPKGSKKVHGVSILKARYKFPISTQF